jgi:hypothetical protein
VSIGRRKITVSHAGWSPQTKFIEVAAGDTVPLAFTFGPAADKGGDTSKPGPTDTTPHKPFPIVPVGWTTTGAFAAGAITMAIVTAGASHDLQNYRNAFPIDQGTLNSKASRVTRDAAIADALGAAAVIAGVVSLGYTISHARSHEVRVTAAPTGVAVSGTFH